MHEAAAPMLDVQFGQASDFGKVRTNNEDAMGSFLPASRQQARSHGYLFAVADGVGGMDLGEVASATAIQVVTEEFAKAPSGAMLISLLPRLIQHANAAVHDCTLGPAVPRQEDGHHPRGVRAPLRPGYRLACGRLPLLPGPQRQGQGRHAGPYLVNEQRKMGLISAEEMATSDSRHVLIRSLGPEMFVSPDTTALTLLPGDVLVLCSDGLHDEMSDDEIASIVSQKETWTRLPGIWWPAP